jgi:hypothetical protein
LWGNKKSAPNWTAGELSKAFEDVVGDSDDAKLRRKKAEELGRLSKRELGRVRAAREIAKLARKGHP